MKNNGNNLQQGNYYLGLDVGTSSVGWAVTDTEYNVLKFKGKSMWGARLFDEASTAEDRRIHRGNRRRLARRKYRLLLLEQLFEKEIRKIDDNFFVRLHESNLWADDKSKPSKFLLFNDTNFTDKDYLKKYPTIYHLRSDLIHNPTEHDIRLVFLALHHLIKYRGHFIYDNSANGDVKTLDEAVTDFEEYLNENDIEFEIENKKEFINVLSDKHLTKKEKKISLKKLYGEITDSENINISVLIEMLSGSSISLSNLFKDIEFDGKQNLSLDSDIEETLNDVVDILGDNIDLLIHAKEVYDIAVLTSSLGKHKYLCDAKVELFKKNKKDLQILKKYIKKNHPEDYKKIFSSPTEKKNYAAYSQTNSENVCSQEEFCLFIKPYIKDMAKSENEDEVRIAKEVEDKSFLTKLKGTNNSVVPYQIHERELNQILKNIVGYLPFMNDKQEDISVVDKIKLIFKFKIPYYVGPLNTKSTRSWVYRSDEKIYPWNFSNVIDLDKTAHEFMNRLIGRCTYTNDPVLPMDSLLYSKYNVLNEINPIKVNGKAIPVEVKQAIYTDLFENSKKKVTRKSIYIYLLKSGHIEKEDIISGVDIEIKAKLKSHHDFAQIMEENKCTSDEIEKIIKGILVYSDDKSMLRRWLKNNIKGLSDNDIKYLVKLNYKEWGRLSKTLLTDIYTINPEDGEACNILDIMWNTNATLMEILNNKKYQFKQNIEDYKVENYDVKQSLHEELDDMYISPAARRSIWQALRIVDEIVDIKKSAPKKIFIEMAREKKSAMKKKRTESRKDALLELYKSCKSQADGFYDEELFEKLSNESNSRLRRDQLYLYYTQMGRSMYSGKRIDFDKLINDKNTYDIDHIYPRSKIKDDSITNRVLVEKDINGDKTDIYPISEDIRQKMQPFWKILKEKGLINEEKYKRLTRNYELTEEELSAFVARQLVETQQSTKALATLLQKEYPSAKIVYSKASNVSEFRNRKDKELPKFREINDLHHAKDAYLNIVVGNVYDTKFTEKFFLNIRNENYSLKRVFDFNVAGAWDAKGSTFDTVKKYMAKNNPIITFAPYEVKGELFDQQIVPKGKGQFPIKQGRDIEKYGGYNKLSGAFLFAVEYKGKKARERSLETVYIKDIDLYLENPIKYCESILGLKDVCIIYPKILLGSLIKVNGVKKIITGRTASQFVCHHPYQFIIDDATSQYLKDVSKYLQEITDETGERAENLGITFDKNIEIYKLFEEKLSRKEYSSVLNSVRKTVIDSKSVFTHLDLYDQCIIIIQLLKLFKCNRESSNLEKLNGKKQVGVIHLSQKLPINGEFILIHQSVTGLFEKEVDLLK